MSAQDRPVIRIGLLRLTDAAPVIVARETGFFAERGLDVRLSVEPSWANIADKLTYGRLDAAVMLPPLALAVSAGLRGPRARLIVPMAISLNGNSVTVANDIADEVAGAKGPLETARRFAHYAPWRRVKPRIAVVHAFSTHNLLLRYWLAAGGLDPARDVEIMAVPPADMTAALAADQIDGFCAGAPWGAVAASEGLGTTIAVSSGIWRNHPEKCLAVREDWAEANPAALDGLLGALLQAARYCDDPAHTWQVAELLSQDAYLGVDPVFIRASLPAPGSGLGGPGMGASVDRSVFFDSAATFPWRSHAGWMLDQMKRWGFLPPDFDTAALAASVYRPDVYRRVAAANGIPAPLADTKTEGAHAEPWQEAGNPGDITMGSDVFCDGLTGPPA